MSLFGCSQFARFQYTNLLLKANLYIACEHIGSIKLLYNYTFDEFLGEWYCSDACRRKGSDDKSLDRVHEYSKALTWDGLNHLVRRDAIREGDGAAVLEHWSLDLFQFANNNHPKYVVLAHQLLAGASYFLVCC